MRGSLGTPCIRGKWYQQSVREEMPRKLLEARPRGQRWPSLSSGPSNSSTCPSPQPLHPAQEGVCYCARNTHLGVAGKVFCRCD